MGTPEFAVASLDAICREGYDVAAVVTVPDRKVGRGQKVQFSAVKKYAMEHNLPVLQPENLKSEDFVKALQKIDADLFVVVAFRMLPKVVWEMPKMGTFNLHASLLPQYRGAAPINWAIINGEKETGVTTFFLNEKIDEGAILLQQKTPISAEDTAESLHDRLASIGAEMVVETIKGLVSNRLVAQKQQPVKNMRLAPKIYKDDCEIDWGKEGEGIVNFVRGLCPYPAATTKITDTNGNNHSFKIYKVTFEAGEGSTCGELKTDGKKYLKIGCKGGFINILSLQIEGKRENSIEDFLRGNGLQCWKTVI